MWSAPDFYFDVVAQPLRAFREYEAKVRAYATTCLELPPGGVGGFLPDTALALWLHDQGMRLTSFGPFRRLPKRTFRPSMWEIQLT